MVGALLATLGAAYIGGPPQVSFGLGEWLTIAGALVFAVHIVLTDRVTKRVEPLAVTLTSFIVVTIGSLAVASACVASSHTPALGNLWKLVSDQQFLIAALCTSVFATLIAITVMNVFQRELDPVRAAIIYSIEPVWAAVIAIGLGWDHASGWLYFGGGAMLAGNLVAEIRRNHAAPAA
jgi:drug/metabolite transporter (DMT)-like permease